LRSASLSRKGAFSVASKIRRFTFALSEFSRCAGSML
jgi:hypothetical protein